MAVFIAVALLWMFPTVSNSRILFKCCPPDELYSPGNNQCYKGNVTSDDWSPPVLNEDASKELWSEDFVICTDGFVAQSSTDFLLFANGTIQVPNVSDIGSFCVAKVLADSVTDVNKKYIARFCMPDNCKSNICVRKCCPQGYRMNETLCVPSDTEFLPQFQNETGHPVDQPDYVIQSGVLPSCSEATILLDPSLEPSDAHYILPSGSIYLPSYPEEPVIHEYCVDDFEVENAVERKALVCTELAHDHILLMKLFAHLMFFSSVFLIATFVIYAIIPEIRNVSGVVVMCHCASLAVAFICLGIIQLTPDLSRGWCHITAIITHFGFLAAFCWLNVMSFDIWWTVDSRSRSANRRLKHRLLYYSIYAWGVPIIIVSVGQILDHINDIPDHVVRPKFATLRCWFSDDSATWTYFYGPIAVILFSNLVFFIMTTVRLQCRNVATSQSRRKKFFITLWLFLLMGVSWTSEIISASVKGSVYYSLPTDILNILTGVFIFIFFVCKKKVRRLLKKKFLMRSDATQRDEHFTMTEMCQTDSLLT